MALKAMLKEIEFSKYATPNCCPVCGGNQHHDSACLLAALIYRDFANSYERLTGGDNPIWAMMWKVNNIDEYKFIATQAV